LASCPASAVNRNPRRARRPHRFAAGHAIVARRFPQRPRQGRLEGPFSCSARFEPVARGQREGTWILRHALFRILHLLTSVSGAHLRIRPLFEKRPLDSAWWRTLRYGYPVSYALNGELLFFDFSENLRYSPPCRMRRSATRFRTRKIQLRPCAHSACIPW
jgi:hypothetical protein